MPLALFYNTSIKYYNPLHVSSLIYAHPQEVLTVLMQHLVSSCNSVAAWCTGCERTEFSLNLRTGRPLTKRTITDAASIQLKPPEDEHM